MQLGARVRQGWRHRAAGLARAERAEIGLRGLQQQARALLADEAVAQVLAHRLHDAAGAVEGGGEVPVGFGGLALRLVPLLHGDDRGAAGSQHEHADQGRSEARAACDPDGGTGSRLCGLGFEPQFALGMGALRRPLLLLRGPGGLDQGRHVGRYVGRPRLREVERLGEGAAGRQQEVGEAVFLQPAMRRLLDPAAHPQRIAVGGDEALRPRPSVDQGLVRDAQPGRAIMVLGHQQALGHEGVQQPVGPWDRPGPRAAARPAGDGAVAGHVDQDRQDGRQRRRGLGVEPGQRRLGPALDDAPQAAEGVVGRDGEDVGLRIARPEQFVERELQQRQGARHRGRLHQFVVEPAAVRPRVEAQARRLRGPGDDLADLGGGGRQEVVEYAALAQADQRRRGLEQRIEVAAQRRHDPGGGAFDEGRHRAGEPLDILRRSGERLLELVDHQQEAALDRTVEALARRHLPAGPPQRMPDGARGGVRRPAEEGGEFGRRRAIPRGQFGEDIRPVERLRDPEQRVAPPLARPQHAMAPDVDARDGAHLGEARREAGPGHGGLARPARPEQKQERRAAPGSITQAFA